MTQPPRQGLAFLIIGTHVDDLFVLHNKLGQALLIKDLGEAVWTLQMTIRRDAAAGKLKICQEPFVNELLQRFALEDVRACQHLLSIREARPI